MKKFFLYAIFIIIGGGFIFILIETIKAKNTGFETKTLWDWMALLIIPLFLAGGAFFLNLSERKAERRIADERRDEDRKLADERAELERAIEKDRQQEAALQAYLHLEDAYLERAYLKGAKIDTKTHWPDGFDPERVGAILVEGDEKPSV